MSTTDPRALNRALLARQFLLERADVAIDQAVEQLVGLQAQATLPPYYGLAARLRGFDPVALGAMLEDRSLIRMTLMRGTVHLVTPRDAAWLRPLVQPAIERGYQGTFGRRVGSLDADSVRGLLRERPLTARELARELGGDEEALSVAVRVFAPLVQVPPRGVWGKSGQARYRPFEDWTGLELVERPVDELVLRYLRAFGPATAMDAQNWSGLTKLREVFARLDLEPLGGGYYDVPDGPRPPADTPAPPRFLGEYDNALLGHQDRTRIVPDGAQTAHGRFRGSLLVDGFLAATWKLEDGVVIIYGDVRGDEVQAEAMTVPGARDVDYRPGHE
jgi:hypothetical protein